MSKLSSTDIQKTTKLLVTGGCGFIGSNFIRYILDKYPNCEVINIDKLSYGGNLDNLRDIETNPHYKFIKGDICDQKLVDETVKEIDGIIHFAAETHVDRSIQSSTDFIKSNVIGTQVLLESATKNGLKRFHYISTDEVFGALGEEGKFNEKSPHDPKNPYAASKASAEHLVRSFFHTHQLPITISNCSNNYGPYQYPEKFIPLFLTNLIESKKVPVYGSGLNVRDWIHVIDHCRAIDLIYHQGKIGENYCICTNDEKRNIDLTKEILSEFGFGEEKIHFVVDRKGHDFRYAMDNSKIKELGWTQSIELKNGLKDTIQWYKQNEWWWKKLKENKVKGIILAGGTGSRLLPLTKVTNKHLLPIYDKPMIFYPLETLKKAGITDIIIVCGTESVGDFLKLLGSGKEYGVNLTYRVQDGSGGIAQAASLAKTFVGKSKCVMILGDNIFEEDITPYVDAFEKQRKGARILLKKVGEKEAKRFGVAIVEGKKVTYVEEKPEIPKSNLAMTGLYMFDDEIFDIISRLKPSKREELEITDALDAYVKKGELEYDIITGFWSDAGTFESLHNSSLFIKKT
ncbi:dTDP-glucose 4,6-dehydratase [Candidatus Woesearchaeota archaeon]|nr:dTDP-glucose 4,6-dehydratase [Candidatus Woesearchaeota archaeon]